MKLFALTASCVFSISLISQCYGDDVKLSASRIWLQAAMKHGFLNEKTIEEIFVQSSATEELGNRDIEAVIATVPVDTTSGPVTGDTQNNVHVFYEIPYAEPPVGDLRFQDPVARKASTTVFDASKNNQLQCMQMESVCISPINPFPLDCRKLEMKEDCLVLNIYVPKSVNLSEAASNTASSLPVMFYIHGGSFNQGTGHGVDGRELAFVANVVVVTINYRLGPFGFIVNTEEGKPDITGNQGLKDQRLAMKWVHDNIRNFGGDPSKVTIFGGSAGAQSVVFHIVSVESAPYYWNAIVQSDPVYIPFDTVSASQKVTDWVVRGVCNSTASRYDCLMNADAYKLANRQTPITVREFFDRDPYALAEPFRPVIDGIEFTKQPIDLIKEGNWNSDKNMIIGVQTEELDDVEYFLPLFIPTGEAMFSIANYYIFSIGTTDKVVKKYSESYPPTDDGNYIKTFGKELSHLFFICPSRALARYAAQTATNGAKVYLYANEFPVVSGGCEARNNGSDATCYYAGHGDETRFVMRSISNMTEDEKSISDQFSNYWGSFAQTGDPNSGLEATLGDFTVWPAYTSSINENNDEVWSNIRLKSSMSEVQNNYVKDICDFWDSLGIYMEPIPLETTSKQPTTRKIVTDPPIITTTSGATDLRHQTLNTLFFSLSLLLIEAFLLR